MSRMNKGASTHHLIKYPTEEKKDWLERIYSQKNLRKASTMNEHTSLDVEMENVNQKEINENPFLKARVQVYIKKLKTKQSKQSSEKKAARVEGSPELSDSLFAEERITFKGLSSCLQKTNGRLFEQLSLKLKAPAPPS